MALMSGGDAIAFVTDVAFISYPDWSERGDARFVDNAVNNAVLTALFSVVIVTAW
jgi:hypothetical protein